MLSCLVASLLCSLVILACNRPQPETAKTATAASGEPEKKLSGEGCLGFTAEDAAPFLGVSASAITMSATQGYEGFWQCSFNAAGADKQIAISVTVSKDAKTAAADMEQLRGNLELAGSTGPFKDNLPKGAYSDISGIGDEAVWTDVNGTLSARKGRVSVQVIQPPGKMAQIAIAEAVLRRM